MLNEVVGAFYLGTDGATAYCPDDLREAVDLTEADRLAEVMDSAARTMAAEQIVDCLQERRPKAVLNPQVLDKLKLQ